MSKDQYVVVSPLTPKGKWFVCSRRVGSRDRLAPIAECRCESQADKIVLALLALQGEVDKLDAPLQHVVVDLNHVLVTERKNIDELRGKLRDEQNKIGRMQMEMDRVVRERNNAQHDLRMLREKTPEKA